MDIGDLSQSLQSLSPYPNSDTEELKHELSMIDETEEAPLPSSTAIVDPKSI